MNAATTLDQDFAALADQCGVDAMTVQLAADRWRIEADRHRAEASRWAKRAQEAESTLRKSPDLAARVAWLEQENAQVIEERGRAFRAVEVLTQRLRDAGLSTDYRG